MNALIKLTGALPRLVGKTIARTMLVFHQDDRFPLWQFFTGGTACEFYGRNDISGARGLDGTTVEAVFRSVPRPSPLAGPPIQRAIFRK